MMPRYEEVSPFFGLLIGTESDFTGLHQGPNVGFQLDQKFLYLLSNQCTTRDTVATVKSGRWSRNSILIVNNSIWNV